MIKPSKIFEVYEQKDKKVTRLYTLNLVPGRQVYDELLTKQKHDEFREWNPFKSKLAASILKGATNIGIRKGSSVLYLGCASGTTASHVSDMVGSKGEVYAVDLAPTVMRDMVLLCGKRLNITPIMEDANRVLRLAQRVLPVDVVYQDLAQHFQVEIFLKNAEIFLKKGGYGLLMVKARSIDVTKKPRVIYNQVRKQLESNYTIVDFRELDPFQKDHCMFMIKK